MDSEDQRRIEFLCILVELAKVVIRMRCTLSLLTVTKEEYENICFEKICLYVYLCYILHVCFLIRYGLPVNFQAMLLQPNKKTMKKLREVLYELYKHLDSSAAAIIDVSTYSVSY